MASLLQYAYIEQRCNACGRSYRVTLYDSLKNQQTQRDFHSGRHCPQCQVELSPLAKTVPLDALEDLDRAWQRIAHLVTDAQLDLKLGD